MKKKSNIKTQGISIKNKVILKKDLLFSIKETDNESEDYKYEKEYLTVLINKSLNKKRKESLNIYLKKKINISFNQPQPIRRFKNINDTLFEDDGEDENDYEEEEDNIQVNSKAKWYSVNPSSKCYLMNQIFYQVVIMICLIFYPLELIFFDKSLLIVKSVHILLEWIMLYFYLFDILRGYQVKFQTRINYNIKRNFLLRFNNNFTTSLIEVYFIINNYLIIYILSLFRLDFSLQ